MKEFEPVSYEQFRDALKVPKYFGAKCFVAGCNNPAEYEGGDARFWCGMCEECVGVKKRYDSYVEDLLRRKRIREKWTKIIGEG